MDEQLIYVIKIEGHLSDTRAGLFGNMEMTPLSDGHTLISGHIVDQSALFGILNRIRDLGTPLISINTVRSGKLQEESLGTRPQDAKGELSGDKKGTPIILTERKVCHDESS